MEFPGQDWRPLDDAEISQAESRLIKPILTADFENTQNFCAGISKHVCGQLEQSATNVACINVGVIIIYLHDLYKQEN